MSSSDLPKLWTEPTKIGHIFRKQSTLKIKDFKKFHLYKLISYSSEKKNQKDSVDFWCRKMTESGLMPNLIKKSWTVSRQHSFVESYLRLFCLLIGFVIELLNWVLSLAELVLITAAVDLWLKIDSGSEPEPPGSTLTSLKVPMEYVLTLL